MRTTRLLTLFATAFLACALMVRAQTSGPVNTQPTSPDPPLTVVPGVTTWADVYSAPGIDMPSAPPRDLLGPTDPRGTAQFWNGQSLFVRTDLDRAKDTVPYVRGMHVLRPTMNACGAGDGQICATFYFVDPTIRVCADPCADPTLATWVGLGLNVTFTMSGTDYRTDAGSGGVISRVLTANYSRTVNLKTVPAGYVVPPFVRNRTLSNQSGDVFYLVELTKPR